MALSLGKSSRREWLATMTSREYAELVAFSRLEPLGYEREDARHGLAAIHICGAMNGKQKAIEDVMPLWQPPPAEQTDDDLFNVMRLLPQAAPLTEEKDDDGDDCES